MTAGTPQPDVVVVGAGNAALVAAISAHESGARVLVLEAAPHAERGGNSRFSGGIFRCAHAGLDELLPLVTEEARRWAHHVDVGAYPTQRYSDDLRRAGRGRADLALSRRLVHESMDTVRWMADRGVRWELSVGKLIDPDRFDGDTRYVLPPGGALRSVGEGIGLMADLFSTVERLGIEVWYDAPVVDLVMDGASCRGVVVRRPDGDVALSGVVVLAAGGFEANPEMRQRWLGADTMSRYSYPYGLLLNADAQRFVDEGEDEVWLTYAKTGAAIRDQPGAWAFQLFDAKTRHLLEPRYSTGTPVTAGTLAELADLLGVDADALKATVHEFNAACPDAEVDPFRTDGVRAAPGGQPAKSHWSQPLDTAPYVAYPVTCGITFTYGGLCVDDSGRVQDITGRPMAGLHATGEITGGFFFHNYPAGSGLMRGAVFGRLAGTGAATEALSTGGGIDR